MTIRVESAVRCGNVLGEGAFWDARRGRVWWVDVPMPSLIQSYDPETRQVAAYPMPEMVTCVRSTADGANLIVACHSGVSLFNVATGALTHLLDPEPQKPFNRSNDGGTDAKGRFWFGTMQNNLAPNGAGIEIVARSGILYRLDADMRLTAFETDVGISNTVCWSPDGRTLYFCDTMSGVISAYEFDLADGVAHNKRAFATFERGVPDGSTVDADGCLWNARWDGACVVRFTPRGDVDRVIELPVAKVTSCTFGGAALNRLFITTARYGMSPAETQAAPLSGDLFVCEPGASGYPTAEFG